MAETMSQDEFEHFHKDGMLRIEKEKLTLANMKTQGLESLDQSLVEALQQVLLSIPRSGRVAPEDVFRRTIQCLPSLDRQRMLIDNLLESLKHGAKLSDTMRRFRHLGLLPSGSASPAAPDVPGADVSENGLGSELVKRTGLLRRVATSVVRVAINALKSIPKWVEIEPTITLVGPIPTISFTLKGKGMGIQDLFEILSEDPAESSTNWVS